MANPLGLDRQLLAQIINNHEAIKAFERVFKDVGDTLPNSIEDVELGSGSAQQQAAEALAGLADIARKLSMALLAPALVDQQRDTYAPQANYIPAVPDFEPPVFPYDPSAVIITGGLIDKTIIGSRVSAAGTFSTMTTANAVISGGTINGTTIGATSASTGKFSTIESTGLTSLNTAGNVTLIGSTFASTGNGKLQVHEVGNEFIIASKNAASKEWVWGVNATSMYFRNATDAVNVVFMANGGRILVGNATDDGATILQVNTGGIKHASATLLSTSVALTNGAGAAVGTLNNSPAAGDPVKWLVVSDNGTLRRIPSW